MSHSLAELVEYLGIPQSLSKDVQSRMVEGIGTLAAAGPAEIAFLANDQYLSQLAATRAAAVLVRPEHAPRCPSQPLICDDPYTEYAKLTHLFVPDRTSLLFGEDYDGARACIHPSAVVSASAELGEDVFVGANAWIGDRAVVGRGCRIAPGAQIGADSRLGENCLIYPQVTLYHDVQLGARCIVHSQAVIGADGFGFAPGKHGMTKIEQLGGVRIGDDVEIGASTTIDRGALDHTRIGNGVKLDNQIQIAHNVEIGDHTVIAACVGISGSTRVGRQCMIGGGVGLAGHLTITDGVHFTGMTLVTRDIDKPGVYSSGTAVEPNGQWRKNVARFRHLDTHVRMLKTHEQKIRALQDDAGIKLAAQASAANSSEPKARS